MAKSAKTSTGGAKKPAKPAGRATAPKAPARPDPKRKPAAAPKPSAKPAPKPPTSRKAAEAPTKPVPAKQAPAKPAPTKAKKDAPAPAPAKGKPADPAKTAPAPAATTGAAAAAAAANSKKPGPKGITIVQNNRPSRRPKVKKLEMPISEPLLKPGGKWKPLIPSGPKAAPTGGSVAHLPLGASLPKSKLTKKELDKYRQILLQKRAELIGDVNNMEDEALRQNSGALSSLPQHMAEQGSETYDQTLSLDLAQVDRNLIREIDEALARIDAGTYGVCLRTGKLISAERLQELPWAKYSIEAAREMERRPYAT